MVKIQPCNKSCGKLIVVQFDDGIQKYVPFEVDTSGNPTNKHNCPNSEYNKNKGMSSTTDHQKQQTEMGQTFSRQPTPNQFNSQTTTTTGAIDRPSLEATLLNQISQKLDSLVTGHNELVGETTEKQAQNFELNKLNNIMLNAIVEHLKLNEPKTAAELWAQKHPDATSEEKYQQEREQIAKWNQAKDVQSEDREMEEAGL